MKGNNDNNNDDDKDNDAGDDLDILVKIVKNITLKIVRI